MRFLSVCSGIEAASVAWEPLGWKAHAFAEIEAFPSSVLAARYPNVPNWGDMTKFRDWPDATIDVLVGGTPCQSFSVAGLRKGMADPRGNLALTYLAIADRYRPEWLVWENVPGVLSSSGGRDFGAFLGGLGELGYGFAYRVLDAQYVRVDGYPRAVPQRRRRVFVVGHSGDWRRAAAVLFEPESLSGNPPPRREAGERIADSLTVGANQYSGFVGEPVTAPTLDATMGRKWGSNQWVNQGHAIVMGSGQGNAEIYEDGSGPTLTCLHEAPVIAHALRTDGFDAGEDGTGRGTPLVAHALRAQAQLSHQGDRDTLVPVVAKTLTRGAESAGKGGYAGRRQEDDDNLVATPYTLAIRRRGDTHQLEYRQDGTANAVLTPNGGRAGIGVGAIATPEVSGSLTRRSDGSYNGPGQGMPIVAHALRAQAQLSHQGDRDASGAHPPTVAFGWNKSQSQTMQVSEVTDALQASATSNPAVAQGWAVRRLTPTECARLQGFPDDYLDIQYRGKPAADGPKYKALGNSFAVNTVRWIGQRIQMVNDMAKEIDLADVA